MSSVNFIQPNQLDMSTICINLKEKESRVNYVKRQEGGGVEKTICIKHKQVEDEDEVDDDDLYPIPEIKQQWINRKLDLLDGAIAFDDDDFDDIHPQLQPPVDHDYIAASAVLELSTLALDNNGFLWTKSPVDGIGDILDTQHYQQTFPKPPSSSSCSMIYASRASAVVKMEHTQLLKWLTTERKWVKLFPSIVSGAVCLRFLHKGSSRHNPDGSLQLFHTALHAPTHLVPMRNFAFLRTCKQIDHSTWVVADISVDASRNVGFPQGCLIQGLGSGLSKVTWVEHFEFQQNCIDHKFYTYLTSRGFGYGAQRWVACVEQSCERRSFKTITDILVPRFVGLDGQCQYEKISVMRLSRRMVRAFCFNLGSRQQPLSSIPDPDKGKIFAFCRRPRNDPTLMLIISSITFTLPHSPDSIIEILGDERTRHEWDPSGNISPLTKPTCYTTGNDPRNKISVYQTRWIPNKVLLQEATVNRSGSLLVWSLLKSDEFDLVRFGKCGESKPFLTGLSGLAIGSNSSSNTGGGSVVTLSVQQEVRGKKGPELQLTELARKYILEVTRRMVSVIQLKTNKRNSKTGTGAPPPLGFNLL